MTTPTRRNFIKTTTAATLGGALAMSRPSRLLARGANQRVGLGFISCGGRARQLMNSFIKSSDCDIVAICDPDKKQIDAAKEIAPGATAYRDLRKLLEDKSVDAVVVATSNHWHCLAAIWAMEAGKHVYVEKPLSHSQWEGDQCVAAARKYNKICQIGTQQRSDPMQAEIKKFLHEEKALGEIKSAQVNRYGVRGQIGKRDTPLKIPQTVDYDLWLGPAEDQPLYRNRLQYDWHWDWNTGSGEMGNWGVHVLDDVRNTVFLDKVKLPKRIFGGGGRVAWGDAGQTPNVHFTYFDTGSIPVVIGLSNVAAEPGGKKAAPHHGPGSGYVAICEGGEYHGYRGGGEAYDADGKLIKRFRGNKGDHVHQQNFLTAILENDASLLNADVEIGHHSTGWCNLANISYRAGTQMSQEAARSVQQPQWQQLMDNMEAHLAVYDLKISDKAIQMSPMLELNDAGDQFVGQRSDLANSFLKREYRKNYAVPELAAAEIAK